MKFLRKHYINVNTQALETNFILNGSLFYKTILSSAETQTFIKIRLQQNFCKFYKNVYILGENPSYSRRLIKNNFNYLSSLSIKKGFKLKSHKFVKSSFKNFFDLFIFCNDTAFIQKYNYFTILKSYAFAWTSFFNISSFLNLVLPFFEFIFTYKCVKIEKKLKKRTKTNFKTFFSFLKKKNRTFYVIRLLYFFTNTFKRYKFSDRLFCALINTFLLLKKSFLYQQKLKFYRKILSTNKLGTLK